MAALVARLLALECKVCLESYAEDGGDQTPMSLPCGHSLCRNCCNEIWEQGRWLRVRCPFDRIDHLVRDLNDIPRNLPLIEIVTELREQAGEPAPPPARAPTPQDQPSDRSSSDFEARRWGWNFEQYDRAPTPAPAPQDQPRDSSPSDSEGEEWWMNSEQYDRDTNREQLENDRDVGRSGESGRREQAGEPVPPPAPRHIQRNRRSPPPFNRPLNAPNQPIQQPPITAHRENLQNVMLEREARLRQLRNEITRGIRRDPL